ncbi:hypothetical protein [Aeromonas allosaccharophila]|uniref:hypothetical protein n=1 Tax=Aeromonas allosaccharophila TaxID=656 RepID=UPI0035B80E64
MKEPAQLTPSEWKHIVINCLDRLFEFYIIMFAAKSLRTDVMDNLTCVQDSITKHFKDHDFSDTELHFLNVKKEALDILQMGYSFEVPRLNNAYDYKDDEKIHFAKRLSTFIKTMNKQSKIQVVHSANPINITSNRHFFAQEINKPDDIKFTTFFTPLKGTYPCLHLLRMADILNVPTIEKVVSLVHDAYKGYREILNGRDNQNYESAIEHILKLVRIYPERLFMGVHYTLPDVTEIDQIRDLSISFHHTTSASDLQEAIEDITYQFERFKSNYHKYQKSTGNSDKDHIRGTRGNELLFEKAKNMLVKPIKNNRYIKQENSIDGAFEALKVWQNIPNKSAGITPSSTIRETKNYPVNASKKMRDKLNAIGKHIERQRELQKSLQARYLSMRNPIIQSDGRQQDMPEEDLRMLLDEGLI